MQITSRGKTGPEAIILCREYEVYGYSEPVCTGIQVTRYPVLGMAACHLSLTMPLMYLKPSHGRLP
jgi:hypothetical protein